MTPTEQLFKKYVIGFHSLTFDIKLKFSHIKSYSERLIYFMKIYQSKVKDLRKSFLKEYILNKDFRDLYHTYMDLNQDVILFANLNMSAADERKFSREWYIRNIDSNYNKAGDPKVSFVFYWYQVILWEMFNLGFDLNYWKSRDVGASFAIVTGSSMALLHKGGETLFLSRTEGDVDQSGDKSQTMIGRIRGTIDYSLIYSRKNFIKDAYLSLKSSSECGVTGGSTSGTTGSGGRKKSFIDEAGIIPKLRAIASSLTDAGPVSFLGTLKFGYGEDFKNRIKEGEILSPTTLENLFEDFKNAIIENLDSENWITAYRDAKQVFFRFSEQYAQGTVFSFCNTFRDHPLKAGSDYEDIMIRRYGPKNTAIINNELYALLDSGNPDKSFEVVESQFRDNLIDMFDLTKAKVFGGFDPGSRKTTFLVPYVQIMDQYYMLPAEEFDEPNMFTWLAKMRKKYPTMVIIPESSVLAYSKAGSGWLPALKKAGFKVNVVTNRAPETQLMVVNTILSDTVYNYDTQEMESRVIIDSKNKEVCLNFIQGGKYGTSSEKAYQTRISHPADAMISALYEREGEGILRKLDDVKFHAY